MPLHPKSSIVFTVALYLLQFCCYGVCQVVINEVAVTGIFGVCSGAEYIELNNIGISSANLSSYVLHNFMGPNDTDAFTLPSNFVLNPGELRLLCKDQLGSFYFSLENQTVVTLVDTNGTVASTTGIIPGTGTSSSTYQLTASNDTYLLSAATPGSVNFVTPTIGLPIISEVAPFGTENLTLGPCTGGPYVEIFNDAFATLDLTGYSLMSGENSYIFPGGIVEKYAFSIVCTSSLLTIGPNDDVSISNPSGIITSRTGTIGGTSPRPGAPDLTWVRVTDYITTSAPFTPFYQYSTSPTPNATNIFPFEPIQLPLQPCGIQTAPLSIVSDYELKQLSNLDVNGGDPELSGGTLDPRTCNHLVVGDGSTLHEITVTNNMVTLLRARPLIGGSRTTALYTIPDSEGICFYNDPVNGDKIAILDERDHSVLICDIPITSQLVPIFRDSSNCRVAKLNPEQINNATLTNLENPNESFEGIACDPVNGKLYIATEVNPRIVWSVDFATGIYEVLIDVERLPSWTILDMNGLMYDPLGQSLYVLSSTSKVIVQSSLNGTIIGESLSVGMIDKPGGLSYEPVTGDLLVFGEPAMFARFSKKALGNATIAPTSAPEVISPTNAPVSVIVDAPEISPPTTESPVSLSAESSSPIALPLPVVETPTKIPKMGKSMDKKMESMDKKEKKGKKDGKATDAKKNMKMGKKGKGRDI